MKNHWNSTIKRKLEMGFYAGEVFGPNELEELLARVSKDVQVGCLSTVISSKMEAVLNCMNGFENVVFFIMQMPSCPQDGVDNDSDQKTYPSVSNQFKNVTILIQGALK